MLQHFERERNRKQQQKTTTGYAGQRRATLRGPLLAAGRCNAGRVASQSAEPALMKRAADRRSSQPTGSGAWQQVACSSPQAAPPRLGRTGRRGRAKTCTKRWTLAFESGDFGGEPESEDRWADKGEGRWQAGVWPGLVGSSIRATPSAALTARRFSCGWRASRKPNLRQPDPAGLQPIRRAKGCEASWSSHKSGESLQIAIAKAEQLPAPALRPSSGAERAAARPPPA